MRIYEKYFLIFSAKPLWDESPDFVIQVGQQLPMFGGGSTLGPANVYTYRTPDYMLSSTQNYKSKSSLYLHNSSKDFIFQYRFFIFSWMDCWTTT